MASRVNIPGHFFARYEDGKITSMTFMPSASDAGYFGPAAIVFDGDEIDIENVDGPFWRAVQDALQPTTFVEVGVTDNGDKDWNTEDRTTVAIGWEE